MTVVKENPANIRMKNPPLNVGVLAAPNGHHKPVLYSDKQAEIMYRHDSKDVFHRLKQYDFNDKKKTPKSIFIIPSAAVGAGLLYKLIKRFKK